MNFKTKATIMFVLLAGTSYGFSLLFRLVNNMFWEENIYTTILWTTILGMSAGGYFMIYLFKLLAKGE